MAAADLIIPVINLLAGFLILAIPGALRFMVGTYLLVVGFFLYLV